MKYFLLTLLRATCVALALSFFLALPVRAQTTLALDVKPFAAGEELIYEAEFSRAVLRKVDVADFRFTSTLEGGPDQPGQPAISLRLTGDVASKGFFSKLFNLKFHEHIESIVDPVTFSVLRTGKLDEQGKRLRHSEAVFDRTTGKVMWTERDPNNPQQEPRVISGSFSGVIQDLVSAIYFVRSQPLQVGKRFEVQVSDSGRIYRLPVNVVERRRMKTVLGRISVIRIEPELFGEDRLVRGKGKFSIWLSDDERRVPVRADLSNELGKFEIKLKRLSFPPPRQTG
ncbi:MAG: hypothetical protein QOD75_3265 [Blastocatellia bacterium]|jgi:hypothetical protein|nr:hypothetical protein [Blastocatellia bacterium]